jgi:non-ribosomal peptide synthetase component F
MKDNGLLYEGFLRSARQFPKRLALEVENRVIKYSDLQQRALRVARTLQKLCATDQPPLAAVFGYRSATAFAGVLATLSRGHGYVPPNLTFPPERSKPMLESSGYRAVIVDDSSTGQLPRVLEGPVPASFQGFDSRDLKGKAPRRVWL